MDFFPKAWLARREGKSAIRGLEAKDEGPKLATGGQASKYLANGYEFER